ANAKLITEIDQANVKIVLPDQPQIQVQAAAGIAGADVRAGPAKWPITVEFAVNAAQEQQPVEVEDRLGLPRTHIVFIRHQMCLSSLDAQVAQWFVSAQRYIEADVLPWRGQVIRRELASPRKLRDRFVRGVVQPNVVCAATGTAGASRARLSKG